MVLHCGSDDESILTARNTPPSKCYELFINIIGSFDLFLSRYNIGGSQENSHIPFSTLAEMSHTSHNVVKKAFSGFPFIIIDKLPIMFDDLHETFRHYPLELKCSHDDWIVLGQQDLAAQHEAGKVHCWIFKYLDFNRGI